MFTLLDQILGDLYAYSQYNFGVVVSFMAGIERDEKVSGFSLPKFGRLLCFAMLFESPVWGLKHLASEDQRKYFLLLVFFTYHSLL